MLMTTKTVSIPAYHELRDGTWVRLEKILADPDLQAQLVNKRRFKNAVRKLKRAGLLVEL
jgi:hypothetical protein